MNRNPRLSLVTFALLASSSSVFGAVTFPSWYGTEGNPNPNTTSQIFQFRSDATTTAPDIASNSYGAANAVVVVGNLGSDWQSPSGGSGSNPGYDLDGAWDIGPDFGSPNTPKGNISFSLPAAPGGLGPGQTYRIDLMVFAVVFRAAQVVPALQVLGVGPGDIHLDNQGVLSTLSGGGTWEYRTWSTTIQDATNNSISMTLAPPGTGVSVIDRVEIYTRYTVVPEPSMPILVMLPGLVWCIRRRRR